MSTLAKQRILKIGVLVYHMIQKGLKLCPNNSSIATECRCSAPVEMSFAWFYPGCQLLTPFCFGNFGENFTNFYQDKVEKMQCNDYIATFTHRTLHNLHPDMQGYKYTKHLLCSYCNYISKGKTKTVNIIWARTNLGTSTHWINTSLKYIHCNLRL